MTETTAQAHLSLNPDQLDSLEQELIDLAPGALRTRTRNKSNNEQEAAEIRRDLLGIYREGIKIASTISNYPLLPLLQSSKHPIPVEMQILGTEFGIQLLEIVFAVRLPNGIFPAQAEFALDFSSESDIRPSVVSFFPPETRKTVAKIEVTGKIGLTGELKFATSSDIASAIGLENAFAEIGTSSSFVAGPFNFNLQRTEILADGLNQPRVQWKYLTSSHLSAASEFRSWVVIKHPYDARRITVHADLGVLPFKSRWLIFRESLKPLRDSLKIELAL
jgi:hypothetical protein